MPHFILLQYLLYMNSAIGLSVEKTEHCLLSDSASEISSCNRVTHRQTPRPDEIRSILSYFNERRFTWAVEASEKESQEILKNHGLRYKATFPAMKLNLDNFATTNPSIFLKIKKIKNDEKYISELVSTISRSFNVSEEDLNKAIKIFVKKVSPHNVALYIAYYENIPVASAVVLYHTPEIITMHWVGTLPAYRKRGIAHALASEILLSAKNAGYKQVVLLSSPSAKSLYERIGFQEYAQYSMYGNY